MRGKNAFTCDMAERNLAGPMSDDLPENIEAIEKAIGEANLLTELFDTSQGEVGRKLEAFLLSKDLMPSDNWDMKALALKITERVFIGGFSWDFGLGKIEQGHLALYERLKDRPSVKKTVDNGGLCNETFLVIKAIAAIDEILAKGGTYADALDPTTSLGNDIYSIYQALLSHAEERFKTTIKSDEQLKELLQVSEDVENIDWLYLVAIENRYRLALNKSLREGGKYKDLLDIKPGDFGLPEKWEGDGQEETQATMIRKSIRILFRLGNLELNRPPFREVSWAIEAPYSEVLKASKAYDGE